jgi:hypothetical protein
MGERRGCAEVQALLPELAAGVAAGDERARALRHLNGCVDCRQDLSALAALADEILALAPAVEPPAGFETAVLRRIVPPRRRQPWWHRRALRLVVTAVLAVAVGVVAGGALAMRATADDRRIAATCRESGQATGGRYLAAHRLDTPDAATAGRVYAYQGTPSWVLVVVQFGTLGGSYEVRVVTLDREEWSIGAFVVTGGDGSWVGAIDVDVDRIAEIRLSAVGAPPLTAVFR